MTDDLVTRLKEEAEGAEFSSKYADLVAEAAARIEADAATIARAHQAWLDADKLATERLRQLVDAEAKVAALVEALEAMRGAVCGETGFAECVRRYSGNAYPWPALDAADEAARAAIAAAKEGA